MRAWMLIAGLALSGAPGVEDAASAAERWVAIADSAPGSSRLERLGEVEAAEYRVVREGVEVWRRSFDFVPEHWVVTPNGSAALAGMRPEPRDAGRSGEPVRRDLVLVILGAEGELLQEHRIMQVFTGFHTKSPFLRGLLAEERMDLVLLRLGAGEVWWTYRLSSGALQRVVYPKDTLNESPLVAERLFGLGGLHFLPEQQLLVALWTTGGGCSGLDARGDTVVLMTPWGKPRAVQPLGALWEDGCMQISRVEADAIELRAGDGSVRRLAIGLGEGDAIELRRW